jgi:hypothetical protein
MRTPRPDQRARGSPLAQSRGCGDRGAPSCGCEPDDRPARPSYDDPFRDSARSFSARPLATTEWRDSSRSRRRVGGFRSEQAFSSVTDRLEAKRGRRQVVGSDEDRETSVTERSNPAALRAVEHEGRGRCVGSMMLDRMSSNPGSWGVVGKSEVSEHREVVAGRRRLARLRRGARVGYGRCVHAEAV